MFITKRQLRYGLPLDLATSPLMLPSGDMPINFAPRLICQSFLNASLPDRRVTGKVTGWDNNRSGNKRPKGPKKSDRTGAVYKSQEDVWEKYRKCFERIQIYMMSYDEA